MTDNIPDNWIDIDKCFEKKPSNGLFWEVPKNYQEVWRQQGWTKSQVQQYLDQGFTIDGFMFLAWLRDEQKLIISIIKQHESEIKYLVWIIVRKIKIMVVDPKNE